MKFFRRRPLAVLFPLVVSCRVLALPLAHTSETVTAKTYIPLIVVSISLFFFLVVFLAIKFVYMKHRRIGTIHAPPGTIHPIPTNSNISSSTPSFRFRNKQGNRHRGLLVGCLGSPTWETTLTSKLDGATWRREQRRWSSSVYQLHTGSIRSASALSKSKMSRSSSRFTKSTALTGCSSGAGQLVLSSSSGPERIPVPYGDSFSMSLRSVHRNASTNFRPCYGDFGEFHGTRLPEGSLPNVARRASPSSIRLVDGPSYSSQVDYSFLSGLPPNAIVVSPLMGTRDSFQLSRYSLNRNRKPVPPLPPLPSFLPFYLSKGLETQETHPLQVSEYLPTLHFSPLASVARVFYSQQQVLEKEEPSNRVPGYDESENTRATYPNFTSSTASQTQHASNTGSLTASSVVQETPAPHPIRKANKWQSCMGLAIGGSSPQTTLVTDEVAAPSSSALGDGRCSEIGSMRTGVLRTPSGSSRSDGVLSKKPLKSCLRQHSLVPTPLCSPDYTFTPSILEASSQTCALGRARSTGDQASVLTPISDVDIGILGLDRFHWNDEIKELKVQSCHMKKDSIALVPYWE